MSISSTSQPRTFYLRKRHDIFPCEVGDVHHSIFLKSLEIMSRTLRRDIYSLRALGYPIERVGQQDPDPHPLAASRYSCIYWASVTLEGHRRWVRSVAFSHDSTRLASASSNNTVKIWDASSGECLQTFEIGKALFNISVDTTSSYLHTEIGTIAIDVSSALNMTPSLTDPQNPRYQGLGLSSQSHHRKKNSFESATSPTTSPPPVSPSFLS